MNDSITGHFSIKGAPETFVSTMVFLFADRDDLTVSEDYGRRNSVNVTPSGPQPCFRYCRLQAYALQEGPTQIRYFAPSKGDMERIIEDVKATLKQRGFIIDTDSEPAPALEAPQPDDQAGEPAIDEETERRLTAVRQWPEAKSKGVKRRDYVERLGISESGLTRWRDELRNRGFDVPDF